MVTRAPDRFSAAQFSPLLEHENHQRRLLICWYGAGCVAG